jgi:hypothetical protein
LVARRQVEILELGPSGSGIGVNPDDLLAAGVQVGQPPDTCSLGDGAPELGLSLNYGSELVDVPESQTAGD